ncbi:hypothetical protein [Campylobacter estrildidarum]|uniref:Uncharacterized protein n=1 Tax=Campylobacter estrildidarum TaxID=2510189 RepID=A0A4U7BP02_9BACT|nr:hypothetical protein [Campylobacter estrildidarum]TKX30646.1 hypothetical protein CQA69_05270 [Campylobacter estrildidarum]
MANTMLLGGESIVYDNPINLEFSDTSYIFSQTDYSYASQMLKVAKKIKYEIAIGKHTAYGIEPNTHISETYEYKFELWLYATNKDTIKEGWFLNKICDKDNTNKFISGELDIEKNNNFDNFGSLRIVIFKYKNNDEDVFMQEIPVEKALAYLSI